MVKKMASRFRSAGPLSLSLAIWIPVRRLLTPSLRTWSWLLLDLGVVLGALYGAVAIGSERAFHNYLPVTHRTLPLYKNRWCYFIYSC